jgi:hypothetical protein
MVVGENIEELVNPNISPEGALLSSVSSAKGMLFGWILCGIALVGLVINYMKF